MQKMRLWTMLVILTIAMLAIVGGWIWLGGSGAALKGMVGIGVAIAVLLFTSFLTRRK